DVPSRPVARRRGYISRCGCRWFALPACRLTRWPGTPRPGRTRHRGRSAHAQRQRDSSRINHESLPAGCPAERE
ncbi:MAG: hypothetical protein DRP56_07125, partial [Planctomycetota bacterium]